MALFGRKKRHKLPKFPSMLIPTFRRLCVEASEEQIESLYEAISTCMKEAEEASQREDNLNIFLAREIASHCRLLLAEYDSADERGQRLIVGAVRYFVENHDTVSDAAFATGFDDDAKIINHVLEELEIEDQFISL